MGKPIQSWHTLGHHHDRMHDEPGDIMGKIPHAAIHAVEAITLREISSTIEDLKGTTLPGNIFNRGLGNAFNEDNLPPRRGYENLLQPEQRTRVPIDFSDPFPGAFAPQDTPGFPIKTDPLVAGFELPKSPSLPKLTNYMERVLGPAFEPTPAWKPDPISEIELEPYKPRFQMSEPEPLKYESYKLPEVPSYTREEPTLLQRLRDEPTKPYFPVWTGKPVEPEPIPAVDYMKLVREIYKPTPVADFEMPSFPELEPVVDRFAPYKVGALAPPDPYKIDPNPIGMTNYCNDIMRTMGTTRAYEPDPSWKLQHSILDDMNEHRARTSFASPCASLPEPTRFDRFGMGPSPMMESPAVTAFNASFAMARHQAMTIP